ncbi:hypothetical protein AB0P15_18255 [Streptomyces sp. NPDC087917]|uniref:hypothetical protein n=1 Tax=Streptomyces sp. NPDC087917 TaxID=3155060 RepID=UPI003417EEBE
MTEPQHETAPEAPESRVPAVSPSRGRRKGVLLAAVAVALTAGGAVWGVSAVAGADRDAPARYWSAAGHEPAEQEAPARVPANELSGKLLPVPGNFDLGPDLADDGNNFVVAGDAAVQGFKDAHKGLSSTERKKRDEALANLKLKGLAGRSYTKEGGSTIVEVRIMQADPKSLGAFSESTKKVLEALGDGRDAPKVDGFPDAKCSLTALGEEKKETVDSLDCVAVEGDILVNFRAYGPRPFSAGDAAQFLKNQLTHLKSPGESV